MQEAHFIADFALQKWRANAFSTFSILFSVVTGSKPLLCTEYGDITILIQVLRHYYSPLLFDASARGNSLADRHAFLLDRSTPVNI